MTYMTTDLPPAEKLKALLLNGVNVPTIAGRYGFAPETIRRHIFVCGLSHLVPNRKPQSRPAMATVETVLAERKAGMTFFAIDKKLGMSAGTAKRMLREAGLHVDFERLALQDDKTVIGRRTAAGEQGGSAYQKISLARNSMHIRYIEEGVRE
jgi:hypothetical protein